MNWMTYRECDNVEQAEKPRTPRIRWFLGIVFLEKLAPAPSSGSFILSGHQSQRDKGHKEKAVATTAASDREHTEHDEGLTEKGKMKDKEGQATLTWTY